MMNDINPEDFIDEDEQKEILQNLKLHQRKQVGSDDSTGLEIFATRVLGGYIYEFQYIYLNHNKIQLIYVPGIISDQQYKKQII